ncbi:hypothetical protein VCUG_02500 [Vavraia culicis subsp. floridensis]|uniref:Uncharacterized protein n=1 Tax=Vavraia culicis (isolate floridensis) TaxID=948595 RepID=L2GSE7_VAVCU|nr:uncharacterized protein VCUG_02500 [Vavraia culicis subsp. floridensis]ELA46005.1 hypothetical protein VCUG_02500 [Vavraia culicis subsp. floridensis]
MFMVSLGKHMDIDSTIFLCEVRDAHLFGKVMFFIKVRSICREVYKKCKDRNVIIKVWNFCNSNEEMRQIDVLKEVINEFNSKDHVEEADKDRKMRLCDDKSSGEEEKNKENENTGCKNKENVQSVKTKSRKNVDARRIVGVIKLENYQKGDQILYGLQNLSDPDLDLLYYNLSGDLIDISNAITKLISEHNAIRRKKEAAFGENIKNKIERKIEDKHTVDESMNDTYNVALGKETYNVNVKVYEEWLYRIFDSKDKCLKNIVDEKESVESIANLADFSKLFGSVYQKKFNYFDKKLWSDTFYVNLCVFLVICLSNIYLVKRIFF